MKGDHGDLETISKQAPAIAATVALNGIVLASSAVDSGRFKTNTMSRQHNKAPVICIHEDRANSLTGVKLGVLSLRNWCKSFPDRYFRKAGDHSPAGAL